MSPPPPPVTPRSPQAPTSGLHQTWTAPGGLTLRYHVWGDVTAPAGTVVYFDGDGAGTFRHPTVGRGSDLASAAAASARAFVFVDAPDGESWGHGSPPASASAVRELLASLAGGRPVMLVGYSGGAEFLTRHLLSGGSGWLAAGSSAVMVGGGGIYGEAVSSPTGPPLRLGWVVGSDDGYGATVPANWSALEASEAGRAAYSGAGYARSERTVLPGIDHTGYDLPGIVRQQAAAG